MRIGSAVYARWSPALISSTERLRWRPSGKTTRQSSLKRFVPSKWWTIVVYLSPAGLTAAKSGRSWVHVLSEIYSFETTASERSSKNGLYQAGCGWDLRFDQRWRRSRHDHSSWASRSAPRLSFKFHQTCMDDRAWTVIKRKIANEKLIEKEKTEKKNWKKKAEDGTKSTERKQKADRKTSARNRSWRLRRKSVHWTGYGFVEARYRILNSSKRSTKFTHSAEESKNVTMKVTEYPDQRLLYMNVIRKGDHYLTIHMFQNK